MSSSDRSLQSRLLAGAGGGFIAESLTLPTDVIKVRLQLQQTIPSATASAAGGTTGAGATAAAAGRAAPPQYSGMWDCGLKIVERESVAGLWKGYTPAILRQVSYSSLMMVLYDPVRDGLAALSTYACPATSSSSSSCKTKSVEATSSSQSQPSFLFRLAAGGIAGGTSIAVFNPFEVAKTKIQAQTPTTSSSASQKPPLTVLQVFRDVYKVDGVCGFWAGVRPNVIRTFLVNALVSPYAAELGTYDQAKTEIFLPRFGDGLVSHVGASGIAGFVSACVSTPVDVVKTRLMNAAGSAFFSCSQKQYAGLLDAAGSIVREEGPGALYKGFLPICVRKLIWVTAFFVTYERIKKLV
eukprot:g11916.t1